MFSDLKRGEHFCLVVNDAKQLDALAFASKYGLHAGYMQQSNDYFRRLGDVEAK